MSSFSEVVGIVCIREGGEQKRNRVRREVRRLGYLRFADVLAFRLYHRLFLRAREKAHQAILLEQLFSRYPEPHTPPLVLETASPNSAETRAFLERLAPDLAIARCKVLLKPEVFSVPRLGMYVMHPGICPEYRNAHGCFWALARGDLGKVGMTLLKVDQGIDTGPVLGFYSYPFDEIAESHVTIQQRAVFDNLDGIRDKFLEVESGTARTIDTRGRESGNWGQPWLSKHLAWKSAAKRRAKHETDKPALP